MNDLVPSTPPLEPGRIVRPRTAADQAGWIRWLPGLHTLRHYEIAWLRHDVVAGLVLTTVLVPVGIAYAVASGLPGICGLYATIVPLLAYAIFGPSRVLVLGPDSSLVALILAVVLPLAAGDPQRAMALAGMMAVVSGLLCIVAGAAHLGFVTELLSKPIRYGYMNGIALTVLVSQLPALFGFSVDADGLLKEVWGFIQGVVAGKTNWTSLMLGTGTLAVILLLKRSKRLPGVLIAVVATTVIVGIMNLATIAGVSVLGSLPQGLPAFAFPSITYRDIVPVLLGGFAVALVSFADTSVLSRAYAARSGTFVDPNQEMVGLGLPTWSLDSSRAFRSVRVHRARRSPRPRVPGRSWPVWLARSRSHRCCWSRRTARNLPTTTLAAVVIASAIALIEVTDLRRICRIQRWEFWLSIGCLAGVAVLGAIPGIGLAIVIAVIEFLWDGWRPHSAVLGRVEGVKGYHDITRYRDARLVPGLVLLRWDAPLFFANAELFQNRALDAVASSPTPVHWLVVAAEPVTSVDVTAADMLTALDETLHAAGIELCFAEMKDPVKDKLKRFGIFGRLGEERFFPTVGEAVSGYLKNFPVEWTDWEDRSR